MADGASWHDTMDIEARQDDLLRQLDELNARVELALTALIGERGSNNSMAGMIPVPAAVERRKTARAA